MDLLNPPAPGQQNTTTVGPTSLMFFLSQYLPPAEPKSDLQKAYDTILERIKHFVKKKLPEVSVYVHFIRKHGIRRPMHTTPPPSPPAPTSDKEKDKEAAAGAAAAAPKAAEEGDGRSMQQRKGGNKDEKYYR